MTRGMTRSPDQVRALRDGLQRWAEENGLARGLRWHAPAEYYGAPLPYPQPLYLVLEPGDELCEVLWGWGGPPAATARPDAAARRAEFAALVARAGFFMDDGEALTACFLSPADAPARSASRAVIDRMLGGGWRWRDERKRLLVHDRDPTLNAWYDFFADQLLLSPELAARIGAELGPGIGGLLGDVIRGLEDRDEGGFAG